MSCQMKEVLICHSFDKLLSPHVRWLHEASRRGPVRVLLFTDEAAERWEGRRPIYPFPERKYFVGAFRYVSAIESCGSQSTEDLIRVLKERQPQMVIGHPEFQLPELPDLCRIAGIPYEELLPEELDGFPEVPSGPEDPNRPRVIVTGCYDWLHSGHVRFFEEAASYGNLYVAVGNDRNVRALKGAGHPMFPQEERRYMVAGIRYVTQALLTSGSGWLDARPEIEQIRPDIYIVNEDGDRPEKREYCERHGIRYLVLQRKPKPGLPPRQSTILRGF